MLVFIDIDGVLADCTHRLHFLKEKNYDEFYLDDNVLKDSLIKTGDELFWKFAELPTMFSPIFLSSRNEKTRTATKAWLLEHMGLTDSWTDSSRLLLRPEGDYRPSNEVKPEQVRKLLDAQLDPLKKVDRFIFIDDDPKNVRAMEQAFPEQCIGLVFGTGRILLQSP